MSFLVKEDLRRLNFGKLSNQDRSSFDEIISEYLKEVDEAVEDHVAPGIAVSY